MCGLTKDLLMVTNAFCGHKIGNFNINFDFRLEDQYFCFFYLKPFWSTHAFCISNTLISNSMIKLEKKIRRKLCNSPRRKFAIWKLFGLFIHVFIWVMRKAFIIEHVQKKCVCFNEIIWYIIMKMMTKNRSNR